MNTEPTSSALKETKSLFGAFVNRLFCTHDYNLVNEFVVKSEYDTVHESGRIPKSFCSMKRTYIFDYKCSKCSKIKRLVNITSN